MSDIKHSDLVKKIFCGLKNEVQKMRFSNLKDRFLVLDLVKSYEEQYKQDDGGMHIRVPYVMEIGQKVYWVIPWKEFDDEPENIVCECTVTDIGIRGFWISSYAVPQNDHGDFVNWSHVGDDFFFTREEAEMKYTEEGKCT